MQSGHLRCVKIHALRHATASLIKALGVPAKDAQVILGYAQASTTQQIYTHAHPGPCTARRDHETEQNARRQR
jgi:site-specific recombinase XerD